MKYKTQKTIFLSDTHINAGRSFNSNYIGYKYDWLSPEKAENLADFLSYLNKQNEVSEIVLVGDIFDDWICPIDEIPPTFDEIIQAKHNNYAIQNLQLLSKKPDSRVIFLPGNHDMSISETTIKKYFPDMVFGGSSLDPIIYKKGVIHAEHGSQYAMFTAPDYLNNPENLLPLGYFVSRIITTKIARTGNSNFSLFGLIDDLIEAAGPQSLPESIIDAILEETNLPQNIEILMNPHISKNQVITSTEIKKRYNDIFKQWKDIYGKKAALKSLFSELGFLGNTADFLCKDKDTKIVIFGHSHKAKIDKDSLFVKDRIYANCGSWCDEKSDNTFVETEELPEENKIFVRINQWKDKQITTIAEQFITLL